MQNTLLGHSYTVLHEFCEEEGFPSPPPAMTQVIATWGANFRPVQQEVEKSLACVAHGKVKHKPMRIEEQGHSTVSNRSISNGYPQRRSSSQVLALRPPVSPAIGAIEDSPSSDRNERPRIYSVPSQTSLSLATPDYISSPDLRSPSPGDLQVAHAPAGPHADYFNRDRIPSALSLASIAAKKKKPPPPPTKRMPSTRDFWVTALYEFAGQGQGDLVFREGDRIKVVKRTESTDDWWEGELKGVQGSFPANYCRAT